MRLGGPVFEKCHDPDSWIAALKRLGYRAAYCPLGTEADDTQVRDYVQAAKAADIVIAEVGATTPRDMGNVMKALMPRVKGQADGKLVNQVVREHLN